jgi:diguanylate cyclase (GGDEF)-like protein/PAS domain S-box-containing protein
MMVKGKNENPEPSSLRGIYPQNQSLTEHRQNMLNALQDSEEKFRMFAEESPNMIFINQKGKVVYANKKCEEIAGYTCKEFYSPEFDFRALHTEDSRQIVKTAYDQHLKGLEVAPYEYRLLSKGRRIVDVIITTKLIKFNGEPAILGIVTDISKQKAVERALMDSEYAYRTTINSLADAIHLVDKSLHIQLFNKPMLEWHKKLGLPTDIAGKSLSEVYPFLSDDVYDQYKMVFESGKILVTEESSDVGKNVVHTETRKIPIIENGKVTEVITVLRDVSEAKAREKKLKSLNEELVKSNQKLKELALTDAQTGLYNHHYLSEALGAELSRARREDISLSLLKVDVDYFKSVNDVYGHQFGDTVIKQLALKLRKIVRKYNTVVRYGGEEFIILSPNTSRVDAMSLGQRVIDSVGLENFGTRRNSVKLRVSVAVASYPDDKIIKAADMVEIADRCINKAKELGGNRLCSSKDLMPGARKKGKKQRIGSRYLKEKIDRLTKRANQSLIESIFAFAKTIELKDHYTGEHVEKTVKFATDIATHAGLPDEQINLIKQAAILHDLGKVGISEKILLKKTKLTKKEFRAIKTHPMIGADIIRPIHLLHDILPYIMYHHERWDGKGYPIGLKAEEIPLGARIISLADAYQALTSNRPYRRAYTKRQAIKLIQGSSGTQFDPSVVSAFLKVMAKEGKEK